MTADPRPVVDGSGDDTVVLGRRCRVCGHVLANQMRSCARCGGETSDARFGPWGAIWATTTLHVAAAGRTPPYTLAYVDLDAGPRLLAHVQDGPTLLPQIGDRVRLVGCTANGDALVTVVR